MWHPAPGQCAFLSPLRRLTTPATSGRLPRLWRAAPRESPLLRGLRHAGRRCSARPAASLASSPCGCACRKRPPFPTGWCGALRSHSLGDPWGCRPACRGGFAGALARAVGGYVHPCCPARPGCAPGTRGGATHGPGQRFAPSGYPDPRGCRPAGPGAISGVPGGAAIGNARRRRPGSSAGCPGAGSRATVGHPRRCSPARSGDCPDPSGGHACGCGPACAPAGSPVSHAGRPTPACHHDPPGDCEGMLRLWGRASRKGAVLCRLWHAHCRGSIGRSGRCAIPCRPIAGHPRCQSAASLRGSRGGWECLSRLRGEAPGGSPVLWPLRRLRGRYPARSAASPSA